MARRLFLGCVLLLCGMIASCSDATAPSGTLRIVVSPDTVHIGQGIVPTYVTYTEHLLSASQRKVWINFTPELETEVTPGKWQAQTNPDNLYLQPALGDAWAAVTESDLNAARTFYVPLVPGRYRLIQRFQLTASSATQPTGDISIATSNPFVVVSP